MNVPHPTLVITPFTKRNRHLVRDLLSRSFYSHVHLDWHDSDHWMESENALIRLAWLHGNLVGMIGLSEPLHRTAWVRLAAVVDHVDPAPVLSALWGELRQEARDAGVIQVTMLMVRDWPIDIMAGLQFTFLEQIVTLRRSDTFVPETPLPEGFLIRTARQDDVAAMTAVDHAAFTPPWQLAGSDIRQAERVSANATVAVQNVDGRQQIVGYQISTLYFDGSHLARLAVIPSVQGLGIGRALVGEVLRYFARRGVYAMTVNTQAGNESSQRLYRRLSFRHNGYDLPVWSIQL